MKRLIGLCVLLLLSCSRAETVARRPNIVFVLVDDLRWDDIAVAGHPFVQTPNIDRLAREGARFLNAFASTPLCSPSRASILTGQYVRTNGIIDNTARDSASHRLHTFAMPLAAAGYRTAFIGKWHMGNDDTPRPGWTRWVAMRGQGEAVDPVLNIDGARRTVNGYVTDVLTDFADTFVRDTSDAPFMLFLAHKALHPNIQQRDDGSTAVLGGQPEGFVPAPRHVGRYASSPIVRRENAKSAPTRKPALLRAIPGLPPLSPATGTSERDIRGRLEMLLGVDESLGRLVATLTELGELDNTVIVFTSDHGYFYGEHGLDQERRLAYEETARIPLIVRYPKVARAGSTPAQMVQTIDFAPTLLALADVRDTVARQGVSLVPVLDGTATTWRSSVFLEYYTDRVFPRTLTMGYEAVRTERLKYIVYTELPGMEELYDLNADPLEMQNLIGTDRGRTLVAEARAELDRLKASALKPAPSLMSTDRHITYLRHEFHREPEERSAPLWAFLFDVPHLAPFGVFPPLAVLNELLMGGGGDGGMGPGASWTPFALSQREYDDLLPKVLNPDQKALRSFARYASEVFVRDPDFDGISDRVEWIAAVARKYRRE